VLSARRLSRRADDDADRASFVLALHMRFALGPGFRDRDRASWQCCLRRRHDEYGRDEYQLRRGASAIAAPTRPRCAFDIKCESPTLSSFLTPGRSVQVNFAAPRRADIQRN